MSVIPRGASPAPLMAAQKLGPAPLMAAQKLGPAPLMAAFKLRPLVAALLLLFLAACGAAPKPPPVAEAPAAAPVAPKEELNLALVPPPTVPGEAPRRPVSKDAVAKTAAELRALFGPPGQVRREAPAEIWQYLADQPSCVLLFVLYPGEAPGSLRVQHAEVLARRRGASVADADCVGALLKTQPAPGKAAS